MDDREENENRITLLLLDGAVGWHQGFCVVDNVSRRSTFHTVGRSQTISITHKIKSTEIRTSVLRSWHQSAVL